MRTPSQYPEHCRGLQRPSRTGAGIRSFVGQGGSAIVRPSSIFLNPIPLPRARRFHPVNLDFLYGILNLELLGLRARDVRDGAVHVHGRDALPASRRDPSQPRSASRAAPRLPLLAVDELGHRHQGMGGGASQASRPLRDAGRSAQPRHLRSEESAAGRRRAVPGAGAQSGDDGEVRPRHAGRLDGAQRLLALPQLRHRAAW